MAFLKEGENKFQAQCKSGHDFGHDQCSRGRSGGGTTKSWIVIIVMKVEDRDES